ncbi:threonine aldolase family protein [Streptomyces caniferus]|uniref:threonine aldolase family protein n=1 Tax=Streptomyces caniferus TaxID=285557 RepID=UPI00380BFED8
MPYRAITGIAMFDLRSDTVTTPTQAMLRAMLESPTGDDGFGEDASTNLLEERCSEMFGKEAAVFMPSGTMSNQIALRIHTRPGDEVIVDESYHFNVYESAPSADLGGVSLCTLQCDKGILTPDAIDAAIDAKCRDPRYARPTLVSLENTINYRNGRVVPLPDLQRIHEFARTRGMGVHLDGARLFNAMVASGTSAREYGAVADTVSVCFAKGLGAPFGSMLIGSEALMAQARYYRKSYGGALHQSGHLAGAALHALEHHIDRLAEDHQSAAALARLLAEHKSVRVDLEEVQSNIVILDTAPSGVSAAALASAAQGQGLLVTPIAKHKVRFVTHMGVNVEDCISAAKIFAGTLDQFASA